MDPGTIPAAVGVALQVVECLAKTGLKAYKTAERTTSAQLRLNDYTRALKECSDKVLAWRKIWVGFEEADYEQFWGPDGFREVQKLLANIQRTAARIREQVTGSDVSQDRSSHRRKLR